MVFFPLIFGKAERQGWGGVGNIDVKETLIGCLLHLPQLGLGIEPVVCIHGSEISAGGSWGSLSPLGVPGRVLTIS